MSESIGFREHLGELKKRAKVAFLSFVALLVVFLAVPADPASVFTFTGTYVTFVGFFLARLKLDVLPPGWTLMASTVNGPIEVYLVGSLVLALAFNMPIFAYEMVKFVNPALTPRERQMVYPFVAGASLLFFFGVVFGYFFVLKFLFFAIQPFYVTAQAAPIISVADFYLIVFLTLAFTGVAFTIPAFIYLLVRFDVVHPSFFRRNRVVIWIATYIVTAVITPDGGPLLDVILFIPVVSLLELAVWLAGRGKGEEVVPEQAGRPRCRYCGGELQVGSVFCSSCGRAGE